MSTLNRTLAPHPRLFASQADLQRLSQTPEMPAVATGQKQLLRNARKWARHRALDRWGKRRDPSGLGTVRETVDRYITLAAACRKTGDRQYAEAALDYIRHLDELKSTGVIGADRDRGFWLSDGEEAAGIGIVYDWLYETLSASARRMLVGLARKRLLALGRERCRRGRMWWFGKRFSNWNAVCAGGLGILCLSMYDDCPEPAEILPHVERSLGRFIRPLKDSDGGWPEGVGYWNYGMAYAFQYMMSWERTTGKTHPLMKLPATAKTLSFPFDFYPNYIPAGFGDNNGYHPTIFHYTAAMRLKQELVVGAIDTYLTETGKPLGGLMGGHACFCVQHPGVVGSTKVKTATQVAKVYKGLGWGLIADSMPKPRLYLAMRGGNTTEEHCHVDLLSFRVLLGREWMIENGRSGEYLHPTFFSRHRTKINDLNATYKNTIFVNGVGPIPGSATDTEQAVRGQGCYGLRKIASSAMALAPVFCGRLALMVDDEAFVLIDRVGARELTRVESRMHSYQDVQFGKAGAMIRGETECMRVTYASLEPARLFQATTAPATPTDPSATMLRWCPLHRHNEAVLVTLLTPGRYKAAAAVARDGKHFLVTVTIRGKTTKLRIRPNLTLL